MSLLILIADDDPEDLELLQESLDEAHRGLSIITVNGGKAAIKLLDSLDDTALPNLIILDYNMPDMNGAEVLAHISTHARYNNIPKVVFSTSNAERHVHDATSNGAAGYFVKPNTKRQLDEVVVQMLALINTR